VTFNVASRFSDFETFSGLKESADTQKAGIEFRPHSDWLIRGTWSEGFRAPNISELFLGGTDSFPSLDDPCASGTAIPGTKVNCPVGLGPQANPQIRITAGSNPLLTPETSESITAGLVWSPSFVEGLSISLDYYKIDINNAIVALSGQNIANNCHLKNIATACALLTRNATGTLVNVIANSQNIGGLGTQGFDLTAVYNLPEFSWGRVRVVWDTTYLDEFTQQNIEFNNQGVQIVTGEQDLVEQNFGFAAFPRWRSNLDTTWSYGPWEATWGMQYISKQTETCFFVGFAPFDEQLCSNPNPDPATGADIKQFGTGTGQTTYSGFNKLGSTTYHDVQVSYHWEDWRFTLGIDNITDKEPPFSQVNSNSFDSTAYRVPGRFQYIRVSKSF